jgi:hypothetical protein
MTGQFAFDPICRSIFFGLWKIRRYEKFYRTRWRNKAGKRATPFAKLSKKEFLIENVESSDHFKKRPVPRGCSGGDTEKPNE